MKVDETATAGARAQPGMFTTTHWSVVLRVGQEDSTQAMLALDQLCRTYRYPLYAYIRRRGYAEHDAQDLIQGFFALLLKRQALHNVVPGPGTFRSFLLTALNHFLADEHDCRQAQKRGGGQPEISLDALEAEQRYQLEPKDNETPATLYERSWATTLIDRALLRLLQEFAADNRSPLFEELRCFIVAGAESQPYAEVGRRLGLSESLSQKWVFLNCSRRREDKVAADPTLSARSR